MAWLGILAYSILAGIVSYVIVIQFKIPMPWKLAVGLIVATVSVGAYDFTLLIHFYWKRR